ncbi:alpha-ketoacid dehydrogenase subunit beta [Micrococcales bacterium 31B]|nr:alpha-ketoacid dehydrogenase subunit beta [Micrococcales bacterium 31B]
MTSQRLPLAKAINEGLRKALSDDPKTLIMGEDVGVLGGVFRVTDGLHREFGGDRVVDTPLAEAGIVGTAIGLAFRGYRAICEIQFDGFIYPAYNQIVTQLAKMHYRTSGQVPMPIVIRVPVGGGIGAVEHHSESPEANFHHIAGLRIVNPATSNDAYWMIQQSIASNDPVLFFEPKRRYWDKGEVDFDNPPAEGLHEARVVREGNSVTLLAWGPMVSTALNAAAAAAAEGTSVEVIDLRSLSPIDFRTIFASVNKTGRLVIAHEAPTHGGLGGEIAARVQEHCFFSLQAPILRVGAFHSPYPAARLEDHYLPDLDRVLDAIDRSLAI